MIICAHGWREDHGRYILFVPALTKAGYAVLAYDVRGHGLSTQQNGGKVTFRDIEGRFDQPHGRMFLDIGAAIGFLKARKDVNASKVGVMGASFGGYSAYAATGLYPEVAAAVCLSAIPYLKTDELLQQIRADFRPHTILFAVARLDMRCEDATRLLFGRTAEPRDLILYSDSSSHGTYMAEDNPKLIERTLDWLRQHLEGSGTRGQGSGAKNATQGRLEFGQDAIDHSVQFVYGSL